MKTEHEDKSLNCRVRGCGEATQAARRDRVQGATWLCKLHRSMLTLSPMEKLQLRELSGLIAQGQLALDPAGWLTNIAPKPPPRGCPIVMDDEARSPRYVDWRPDLIIGGDDEHS